MTRVLEASGVVAGYGAADEILKGVDFAVEEGEIACIVGPNGAGKSTLFKVLSGLLRPKSGEVRLAGQSVAGRAPRDISRAGLAYVPQEHNVFASMTVRENLEIGGYVEPAAVPRRIEAAYARFPMLAAKRRQLARGLSGGERQILAMAMALMVEPRVLLLDEPTAGLSPVAAEKLFDAIVSLNAGGLSIGMVEQNASEALAISHRAYILVDGRNSRTGAARALAEDPDVRRLFLGG
jgi:branched-chain amino acid transport system ATP-binding protein/neutral amino acid transport system ATP-binding protein